MASTLRAVAVAASLVMGTALAASAAVTNDNHGNTAPTDNAYTSGTTTTVRPGVTTATPTYQTSDRNGAMVSPHLNTGNPDVGGTGGNGGSGAGSGGGNGR